MAVPGSPHDPASAAGPPRTGRSRRRRVAEAGAFVAVWMATGHLLPVTSNGYLLLGIPLTGAFQVFVRRRPLRELLAVGTDRFRLDRRGVAVAAALAGLPVWFAVSSLKDGEPATTGWYLAAVAGAFCAAFALRVGTIASAVRAAVLPIVVGSSGMIAGTASSTTYKDCRCRRPRPPLRSRAVLPATFLLEEVAFRGAIDAHVHHDGDAHRWVSAVHVSALWGAWHLPVSHSLPLGLQAVELVAVHIVLGIPLSFAWRRTRNLAGPALGHAVDDAVRNAVMLGLCL